MQRMGQALFSLLGGKPVEMLVQHKVVFYSLFFAVPVLGSDVAKCVMR